MDEPKVGTVEADDVDSIFQWCLIDLSQTETAAPADSLHPPTVECNAPCQECHHMVPHIFNDDQLVKASNELHLQDCPLAPSYCVNHPLCQDVVLRKDAITHGLSCEYNRCINVNCGCTFIGTCYEQTLHERRCLQKEHSRIVALKNEVRLLEEELEALNDGQSFTYSSLECSPNTSALTATVSIPLPSTLRPRDIHRSSLEFCLEPVPSPAKRSSSEGISSSAKRRRISSKPPRSSDKRMYDVFPNVAVNREPSDGEQSVTSRGAGENAAGTSNKHIKKIKPQDTSSQIGKKSGAPRFPRLLPQGADPANPPPIPQVHQPLADAFVPFDPPIGNSALHSKLDPSSDDIPLSQVTLAYRWRSCKASQ